MLCSDLTLSKRVGSYSHIHRFRHGVDLDRGLTGSGNGNVSGGGEKRLDLNHGAVNPRSIKVNACRVNACPSAGLAGCIAYVRNALRGCPESFDRIHPVPS